MYAWEDTEDRLCARGTRRVVTIRATVDLDNRPTGIQEAPADRSHVL